jgi:hypothetical protein
MKCFSLICHRLIKQYDNKIVSLLRRMAYLEKLTLYLRVDEQSVLMDPVCIINEYTKCMSRLHSFKFYLSTYNNRNDLVRYIRVVTGPAQPARTGRAGPVPVRAG